MVSNQLVDELKNQSIIPWMVWIVILFSTFFLRFSVQLANLVFAHSLGILWIEQSKARTGQY